MVESLLDDVPGARRGPPQDPDQALRVAEEAAGCHHRADRRGARHRHAHRHGDRARPSPPRPGRLGSTPPPARSRRADDAAARPSTTTRSREQGELVVVTGMTGAGRSTAAKELEDLGYFVVDNLPPELVGDVVRLVDERQGVDQPVAAVVDVRAGVFFDALREQLAERFPTRRTHAAVPRGRRRHPGPSPGGGPPAAPAAGRRPAARGHRPRAGGDGRRCAATPTSSSTPRRSTSTSSRTGSPAAFGTPDTVRLRVTVVSFGFKYGVPVDADLLADMRFIPNPFWVPELRPLHRSGRRRRGVRQGPARRPGVPRALPAGDRDRRSTATCARASGS